VKRQTLFHRILRGPLKSRARGDLPTPPGVGQLRAAATLTFVSGSLAGRVLREYLEVKARESGVSLDGMRKEFCMPTRSHYMAGGKRVVGLVCECRTRNLTNGSCAQLLELGVPVLGRYVQAEAIDTIAALFPGAR
jgi:hypothetical protein